MNSPKSRLVLPRSPAKAGLLVLAVGILCGVAHFAFVGSRHAGLSPFGDLFVIVYALACGFFGAMTSLWTLVAFLNRRDSKIATFIGFGALLLAVFTHSFLLNHPQPPTIRTGSPDRCDPWGGR